MNGSDIARLATIGQEGNFVSLLTESVFGSIHHSESRNYCIPYMKKFFLSRRCSDPDTFRRAADTTVKLTDVHLCCQSCVKGVQKAVSKVDGVNATSNMDEKTVSLTGADTATVQKAVDALTAAGYYGKSSDAAITVNSDTGAKDEKVKSLKVEDVHLCCGSCVKAVNKVFGGVSGVTGNTAAKGATVLYDHRRFQ